MPEILDLLTEQYPVIPAVISLLRGEVRWSYSHDINLERHREFR
jgi:hypothetical protein